MKLITRGRLLDASVLMNAVHGLHAGMSQYTDPKTQSLPLLVVTHCVDDAILVH
jgi:hypothetical protein